jgi:hypothetical protein
VAGPAARIPGPSPNATNGAISCATRREARVTGFDCGVGVGAASTGLTLWSGGRGHISLNARGSSPLPVARTQQRDGKAEEP